MQHTDRFLSIIVLSVLVLFPLIIPVGASLEMWSQTYGGASYEYASSLVETSDRGYALAGGTTSFGAGEYDFWLIKTDEYGNVEWNRTYGGTKDDYAKSLVETSDGGYALTGSTDSFGAGKYDFWLVKTDKYGNMEWNQTYGGAEFETAYSLVKTSDGGYALAGETNSFGAGYNDFWLVKTDEYGNMQWNQTYGGVKYEEANCLVELSDGGYALAGWTGEIGPIADFWLVRTDEYGVPEFPSWTILPLLLVATFVIIICKKRLPKTQKTNHIRRLITADC